MGMSIMMMFKRVCDVFSYVGHFGLNYTSQNVSCLYNILTSKTITVWVMIKTVNKTAK